MEGNERPIGYWLKHLDRLIEAAFDRALAEQNVSRRHWQTMNLLKDAPLDESGLREALRPFWGEGAIRLEEVTAELTRRGWVVRADDGRYALTPRGESAHGAIEQRVQEIRHRVSDGLTEEEYRTTLRVLRRMAENLEGALER